MRVYVFVRPGLLEFLEIMSAHWVIIIWTASV